MSGALAGEFSRVMGRDLGALAAQIASYPDDAALWKVGGSITNSAGTLAAHLVGNLEHFVGAVLGGSGYVRDRELEFSERDVARAELVARIERCRRTVEETLSGLTDEAMAQPYPGQTPPPLAGASTHLFLLHLSGHLMWHLGQVDYHRRLLS